MEYLIRELKEKLIERRIRETQRIEHLHPKTDRELCLISSGKLAELDFMLECLENMIKYFDSTKKIIK